MRGEGVGGEGVGVKVWGVKVWGSGSSNVHYAALKLFNLYLFNFSRQFYSKLFDFYEDAD